jgi:hypothetical protein
MKTPQQAELWMAGCLHWRYFILAWLFPILFYLSFIAQSLLGPIRSRYVGWILLGEIGALVLSGFWSSTPYRRQKVSGGQALFWILLVPVFIFVLLSVLPFRLAVTITDIPTSPDMAH